MATTTSSTTTTPVVFTRAASRIALTHILDNVIVRLNINDAFSMAGINNTVGLLTLDDKAINCLVYSHTDSNGTTTTQKLQRGNVGLLKSFIHYVYHRDSIGNPIGNDWLYVTEDMLMNLELILHKYNNLILLILFIISPHQLYYHLLYLLHLRP
jgi:hypothetical protein